jgi:hypothetical protein
VFVDFQGLIDSKHTEATQAKADEFIRKAMPIKIYWWKEDELREKRAVVPAAVAFLRETLCVQLILKVLARIPAVEHMSATQARCEQDVLQCQLDKLEEDRFYYWQDEPSAVVVEQEPTRSNTATECYVLWLYQELSSRTRQSGSHRKLFHAAAGLGAALQRNK